VGVACKRLRSRPGRHDLGQLQHRSGHAPAVCSPLDCTYTPDSGTSDPTPSVTTDLRQRRQNRLGHGDHPPSSQPNRPARGAERLRPRPRLTPPSRWACLQTTPIPDPGEHDLGHRQHRSGATAPPAAARLTCTPTRPTRATSDPDYPSPTRSPTAPARPTRPRWTITVFQPNRPPVAQNDSASTAINTAVTWACLQTIRSRPGRHDLGQLQHRSGPRQPPAAARLTATYTPDSGYSDPTPSPTRSPTAPARPTRPR